MNKLVVICEYSPECDLTQAPELPYTQFAKYLTQARPWKTKNGPYWWKKHTPKHVRQSCNAVRFLYLVNFYSIEGSLVRSVSEQMDKDIEKFLLNKVSHN